MFNKKIVYEALERSQAPDKQIPVRGAGSQDSLVSLLIHDIFGGEILKTHKRNRWHFYNRVDGERIDFTQKRVKSDFEDIPSDPEEPFNYIDKTDYLTFFNSFIRAFEETVGLDKFRPGLSA
jgi:hypothetical protein